MKIGDIVQPTDVRVRVFQWVENSIAKSAEIMASSKDFFLEKEDVCTIVGISGQDDDGFFILLCGGALWFTLFFPDEFPKHFKIVKD